MNCGIIKLFMGIRNIALGLLVSLLVIGVTGTVVDAALLDGLMDGFETSMGKRAEEKGERLIIGNFYQVESPLAHGPLGVMGDHTHNKGEFMATYRYMRMFMNKNRDGTNNLSANDVLKDFAVTPLRMTTEMHMFSFMYGLTDTATLMVMLPYVMKSMDHVTRTGAKFTTRSSGFGDTKLTTLWRLYAFETPSIGSHRFHLNTGVSLPTGDITPTDRTPMGANSLLPFPMRLGSGTVDVLPGLTYAGQYKQDVSWGFQAMGTVRIGHNHQGYKQGNQYQLNTWGAYRLADWISASARFNWKQWYNIKRQDGQLNNTNGMGVSIVPTAATNIRAGKRLDLLGGVNILFPEWMGMENHLSVEAGAPIYQSLDGPQLKTAWTFFAGWQIVY